MTYRETDLRGLGLRRVLGVDSIRGIRDWAAQFTVAPPQHRLCFLPKPQGQGSFLSGAARIST